MRALTVKVSQTDEHKPWPQGLIDQYRDAHASGTKARLALALLLGFGVRRGDTVKLRRSNLDIANRRIGYSQNKTGTEVSVPISDELFDEIVQIPRDQFMLIVTYKGTAYSPEGFGNWFHGQRNMRICLVATRRTAYVNRVRSAWLKPVVLRMKLQR